MAIRFYKPKEPYYEFSNFYISPIKLDGLKWQTVEHYFQAQKFNQPHSPEHMEYYRLFSVTDTPMKAMMIGRQKGKGGYASQWKLHKTLDSRTVNEVIQLYKHLPMRSDWETVRVDVMRQGLRAKIQQHSRIRKLLLETGDAEIIEDSPRDAFWGVGQNQLGKLWMELREEIKNEKSHP